LGSATAIVTTGLLNEQFKTIATLPHLTVNQTLCLKASSCHALNETLTVADSKFKRLKLE
jgi:hypothetical protein